MVRENEGCILQMVTSTLSTMAAASQSSTTVELRRAAILAKYIKETFSKRRYISGKYTFSSLPFPMSQDNV